MKIIFIGIYLFLVSITNINAAVYELSPKVISTVEVVQNTDVVAEDAKDEEIDKVTDYDDFDDVNLEEIEVVSNDSLEQLKYYHDIYLYLFSGAGLTLGGFLTRLGYVFYQTKTGKLIVKHIRNTADDIEDDIVDSISRLTSSENVEKVRYQLDYIEQLVLAAKKRLPNKNETEN